MTDGQVRYHRVLSAALDPVDLQRRPLPEPLEGRVAGLAVGLVEAEKTLATPVSFTAKGEPLRSSLDRLLKSLSLIYTVKDGYMIVTSR